MNPTGPDNVRNEQLIRDPEARDGNIFTDSPLGIFRSTVAGKVLTVNPALARMFGYDSPEEMASSVESIQKHYAVDPEVRSNVIQSALEATGYVQREIEYFRRDRTTLTAKLYLRAVRDADGNIDFLDGFIDDITDRKRSEEGPRVGSEERFRELLECVRLVAVVVDAKGKITFCNAHSLSSLGWNQDELIGHQFVDFVAPEFRAVAAEVFESSAKGLTITGRHLEIPVVTKTGGQRWIQWGPNKLVDDDEQFAGFAFIGRDLTGCRDCRNLQQRLHQAQKMDVIGRLAGGVAHDINNVLQAVILPSELMLLSETRAHVRAKLEGIVEIAQRGASVAQQLLAFSRQQVVKPTIVDIHESLGGMQKMLRQLLRADIELVLEQTATLSTVLIDPGQFVQIVINLVVNSQDAMPNGGRLVVRTADVKKRNESLVEISVADTGCGMTPETRERVFEPFFTTKEFGRGTGLGLSTVYGIVQQCGGWVEIITEPGVGTTMQVFLPVCPAET